MQGQSGGGGGFSLRKLAAKLRGEDTSHEALVEQVDKELKDADTQLKQAQEQLEYVFMLSLQCWELQFYVVMRTLWHIERDKDRNISTSIGCNLCNSGIMWVYRTP